MSKFLNKFKSQVKDMWNILMTNKWILIVLGAVVLVVAYLV